MNNDILYFICWWYKSVPKSPRFKNPQQYHESRIREGYIVANSKHIIINVGKTNFMIFKGKNKNVQHKETVNIAGQNIKQVDHTTFLGYT